MSFALRAGASGLTTYGEAMSVVGSNIANVNTTGYKHNRVNFQDLLATGVAGTTSKIGKGVKVSSVQSDFAQGNVESTTRLTDLAVQGEGFFTVRNKVGRVFYTRAGNFDFDKDGFLVTDTGEQVMVRDINAANGEAVGPLHGAKLVGISDPPQATGNGQNGTGLKIAANLNADGQPPALPFDPTNVQSEMYNFSTAVTVFDEKGGEHVLNLVFRKVPDQPPQINPATGQPTPGTGSKNSWQWYVVASGAEFGGPRDRSQAIGGGFLDFTENGRLIAASNGRFQVAGPGQVGPQGQIIPPGPPVLVRAPLAAGVETPQVTLPFAERPQVIGLFFGKGSNPTDPNDQRTGLDGVTQFSSASKVSRIEGDGHRSGNMEDFDIAINGTIMGRFDNGTIRPVARVVLTRFVNSVGLLRSGDSKYEESISSGRPIQGAPTEGGFGSIAVRNLEKSNVDLANEFVRMIETQRAFQANAKSITTSDEMLADVVSMKR
ncbi:MAG: flagellar hook protein FlgE [Candidatus Lambdaproteobacteria bacterium]|nr:flagellar hook protein FlgE [Candidatus Lambdaproteobacteria bacterium]